jgi:hypothetical protein
MSCSNPFDQQLKDAAKRNEDLLKRTLPEEDPQADLADKLLLDKMRLELEKLRQKNA